MQIVQLQSGPRTDLQAAQLDGRQTCYVSGVGHGLDCLMHWLGDFSFAVDIGRLVGVDKVIERSQLLRGNVYGGLKLW